MHNPTPSFAEEQILFSPLKKNTYKTIAECFLNSLAHISPSFYDQGTYLRCQYAIGDVTTRALIEFHALSGADIN